MLTVSQVAVALALEGVAQGVLGLLVAGEIESVGGAGSQHGDVQPPQRSEQPLRLDDPLQGLVDPAVLGLGVRLQALHPGLGERRRRRLSLRVRPDNMSSVHRPVIQTQCNVEKLVIPSTLLSSK